MARKNLWETLYREAEESASRETITVKSPRLRIQKSPERQYTRTNLAIIGSWTLKCKDNINITRASLLAQPCWHRQAPSGCDRRHSAGGGQLVEGLQPSRNPFSLTNDTRNLLNL